MLSFILLIPSHPICYCSRCLIFKIWSSIFHLFHSACSMDTITNVQTDRWSVRSNSLIDGWRKAAIRCLDPAQQKPNKKRKLWRNHFEQKEYRTGPVQVLCRTSQLATDSCTKEPTSHTMQRLNYFIGINELNEIASVPFLQMNSIRTRFCLPNAMLLSSWSIFSRLSRPKCVSTNKKVDQKSLNL